MRFVRSIFSQLDFWFSVIKGLLDNDYRNQFEKESMNLIFFLTLC